MAKLTAKQKKFCNEYLIDLNATAAAKRTGYAENSARQSAAELMSKPVIQDYISELQAKRSEKTQIDAEWVLKRAALLADFNINKFVVVKDGTAYYDFSGATEDDWYCISDMTMDRIIKGSGDDLYEVERVRLKSYDKLRAIELVGKHVNIQAFNEKQTIEVVDKSDILAKARERAASKKS